MQRNSHRRAGNRPASTREQIEWGWCAITGSCLLHHRRRPWMPPRRPGASTGAQRTAAARVLATPGLEASLWIWGPPSRNPSLEERRVVGRFEPSRSRGSRLGNRGPPPPDPHGLCAAGGTASGRGRGRSRGRSCCWGGVASRVTHGKGDAGAGATVPKILMCFFQSK